MISVLFEGITENYGGKETYIINMYRAMDHRKYKFFFVAYGKDIAYERELLDSGATVLLLPPRNKGLHQYRRALREMFDQNHIDVLWANKTTLSSCEIIEIAKEKGVPIRIIHSHSSSNMGGKFTYIMHIINKTMVKKWATDFFACSEVAAKWFYKDEKYEIIKNAIDVTKFRFSEETRKRIRKEYSLEESDIIVQVGRLSKEKNHRKSIDVLSAYIRINPRAILLICGDGEERIAIENRITELGINNNVKLLGSVGNVNEILQAADVMIMPSYFEGLPFALLEAQCAGLRFLASDTVSNESSLFDDNVFLPLEKDNEIWAKALSKVMKPRNREKDYLRLKEKGFDLKENAYRIDNMIESRIPVDH